MVRETSDQSQNKPRLWWFPSVEVLVFIIVFFICLYVMPQLMNSDGDLGRRITIGDVILARQSIFREDLFSHTMLGQEMILHEWLSDLIFTAVHRIAGLNGIAWMTAVIIASTYAFLTAGLKILNIRTYVRLLAGFMATSVGALHWHTRPHIITTLIFTYFALTLAHYYQTRHWKVLIPLPFVMIFWANLHGAFITGLVLVGLFGIGLIFDRSYSAAFKIGVLFAALVLASFINPYGPQLITHSIGYLQLDYLTDFIQEYNSPNFHKLIVWPFAGMIFISIVLGWRSSGRLGWTPLMLITFWTASGLYSARNIPLYGQVAIVFLASEADTMVKQLSPFLDSFLDRTEQIGHRTWGWMWAIVFSGLVIYYQANGGIIDFIKLGNRFDPKVFPVEALNTLSESGLPKGNVFNWFDWGGYLLYRLWPEKLIFIDGQTDFYGTDLTLTYDQTIHLRGDWWRTLENYQIQWVILPTYERMAPWLDQSEDWDLIYRDNTASVWIQP